MSKQVSPFTPAEQVSKKLKVLVYGDSGTGKTWFALSFPGKVAVIDLEGGTELYGGREDVQAFDVLRTKSYEEVMSALDFIDADNGQTYQTVVVDPITVIWQVLQEAASLKNEAKVKAGKLRDASLTYRDWGIIKNRVHRLYNRLSNMRCHVVVTSRAKAEYENRGGDLVMVGSKPDAEKNSPYLFDVVMLLRKDFTKGTARYSAIVEKDRSGTLPDILDDASFAALSHIADQHQSGEHSRTLSDEEAAEDEAENMLSEEGPDSKVEGRKEFSRPMKPKRLREFVKKRVRETINGNNEWDKICAEENAQGLAIEWSNRLGHDRDVRLLVAGYMLDEYLTSFLELSEAEVDKETTRR